MGQSCDFSALIEGLKKTHYCIAPDLPGHGYSTLPVPHEHLMEFVCEQLFYLLDNLCISNCDLVGYSMGGRIALALKEKWPVRFRKVILLSTHGGCSSTDKRVAREEKMIEQYKTLTFEDFIDWWYASPLFDGMQDKEELVAKRKQGNRIGVLSYLEGLRLSQQPQRWQVPAFYIAGEYDTTYRQLYRKMKVPHTCASGASHYLLKDAPDQCMQWITEELNEHVKRENHVSRHSIY